VKEEKEKWRMNFEDFFNASFEKKEKIIAIPPICDSDESGAFLYSGEGVSLSIFKAERAHRLLRSRNMEIIYYNFVVLLNFSVLCRDEFIKELQHGGS